MKSISQFRHAVYWTVRAFTGPSFHSLSGISRDEGVKARLQAFWLPVSSEAVDGYVFGVAIDKASEPGFGKFNETLLVPPLESLKRSLFLAHELPQTTATVAAPSTMPLLARFNTFHFRKES